MRVVGQFRAVLAGAGAVATAGALAACGNQGAPSNAAVTVTGKTLSIYAAQPPGAGGGTAAADVLAAERLALQQAGSAAGSFRLSLHVAHESTISADARQAVSDKTSIAYLGEIVPGSSGTSVQITNELGLLQVSPSDTAVYLTRSTPAVAGAPQHFYPAHSNFQRTFARVTPTTAQEAGVLIARMRADRVRRLAVGDDGSEYGASVALEVRTAAAKAGIAVSSSPASGGAFFYGGVAGSAATRALDGAASAGATRLYGPSGLYDDTFVSGLSADAQKRLTVSAPGIVAGSGNAAARSFATAFRSAEGHAPAPQAVLGYEAMSALVAVLKQAGAHAAARSSVVDDFRGLHDRASALGTYSISDGDTSIAPFVLAGVSGGKLVAHPAG